MWIELHDRAFDDPRVRNLSKRLNIRMIEVIGHLASLWLFAAKNALIDGNLEPWGIEGIEEASKWDGNPGQWVENMRSAGLLLNNWMILDWDKYTTHHVLSAQRVERLRAKTRKRVRRFRAKNVTLGADQNVSGIKTKSGFDTSKIENRESVTESVTSTVNCNANVTQCNADNLTQPNLTKPNHKQITPEGSAGADRPMTGIQIVMRAYKKAKRIELNDRGWDKANFAVYSRAAKKLLGAFNNDDRAAVVYLLKKADDWEDTTVSWNLATMAKHAWDDRGLLNVNGGGDVRGELGDGQLPKSLGADRVLERRGPAEITHAGEAANGAIEAIRRRGT